MRLLRKLLRVESRAFWEYVQWRIYIHKSWQRGYAAMGFSEWLLTVHDKLSIAKAQAEKNGDQSKMYPET